MKTTRTYDSCALTITSITKDNDSGYDFYNIIKPMSAKIVKTEK